MAVSTASSISSTPSNYSPIRLRLACDACTQAKLRCSKTQPCERCTDNDQQCFYSASRRHGKRKRRRDTALNIDNTALTMTFQEPPGILNSTSSGIESLIAHSADIPFIDGFYGQPVRKSESIWGTDWPLQDVDMTFNLGDTSFGWATPSSTIASAQAPSTAMIPPTPFPSEEHLVGLADSLESTMLTRQPNASKDAERAHDCEAVAFQILQSLYLTPNAAQFGNNCVSSRDYGIKTSLAASLPLSVDTVLSANRAALTSLIPLLKCTCIRNSHNALLYSIILSKAMLWYRVAISTRYQSEGVELQPVKVQLGTLDLDEDDQAMLQRTVLLRELRRGEKVLEIFGARLADQDKVPGWHVLALQNMREELQVIIRKIKKGQEELG